MKILQQECHFFNLKSVEDYYEEKKILARAETKSRQASATLEQ
jgi:hypothetical protein